MPLLFSAFCSSVISPNSFVQMHYDELDNTNMDFMII